MKSRIIFAVSMVVVVALGGMAVAATPAPATQHGAFAAPNSTQQVSAAKKVKTPKKKAGKGHLGHH